MESMMKKQGKFCPIVNGDCHEAECHWWINNNVVTGQCVMRDVKSMSGALSGIREIMVRESYNSFSFSKTIKKFIQSAISVAKAFYIEFDKE